MSAPLAVGVACDGSPAHVLRHYVVDAERRLRWREATRDAPLPDALRHALTFPIPGMAPVLLVDTDRLVALLADGAAWRLDTRGAPRWRPLTAECDMAHRSNPPAFIAGGSACGGFWVATPDRRLWSWRAGSRAPIGETPVPGDARILGLDVQNATAVLETGERFGWIGGRWARLASLLEGGTGALRVRCIQGIALGPPHGDMLPGQILDLPEVEARRLLARGVVEPAPEGAA
jgi:hypothetical protein